MLILIPEIKILAETENQRNSSDFNYLVFRSVIKLAGHNFILTVIETEFNVDLSNLSISFNTDAVYIHNNADLMY